MQIEVDYVDIGNFERISDYKTKMIVEELGHYDSMLYYYLEPGNILNHELRELQGDAYIYIFKYVNGLISLS